MFFHRFSRTSDREPVSGPVYERGSVFGYAQAADDGDDLGQDEGPSWRERLVFWLRQAARKLAFKYRPAYAPNTVYGLNAPRKAVAFPRKLSLAKTIRFAPRLVALFVVKMLLNWLDTPAQPRQPIQIIKLAHTIRFDRLLARLEAPREPGFVLSDDDAPVDDGVGFRSLQPVVPLPLHETGARQAA